MTMPLSPVCRRGSARSISRLAFQTSAASSTMPVTANSWNGLIFTRRSTQLGEELGEALQAVGELRRRTGVGDAQALGFAERGTRHAGHALGLQQRVAEIHVAVDRRAVVL